MESAHATHQLALLSCWVCLSVCLLPLSPAAAQMPPKDEPAAGGAGGDSQVEKLQASITELKQQHTLAVQGLQDDKKVSAERERTLPTLARWCWCHPPS